MTNEFCEMNIYCDESRHTSNPEDAYMVIGALSCTRDQKSLLSQKINIIKKAHGIGGEFGWKKLSPNHREFYWDLLKLFKSEPALAFRCLVVDRNILDHGKYNLGDEELGFYKLYYQMLGNWLKPGCSYHIYLDWQLNKTQKRFVDLRDILQRKLMGKAKIACLEPVSSHSLPILQLADLFIGAVGYAWNEREGSSTKVEFCQELAQSVGFDQLKASTFPSAEKFNIFHFTGR